MRGLRREELQEQALQAFLVLLDDSSMRGLRLSRESDTPVVNFCPFGRFLDEGIKTQCGRRCKIFHCSVLLDDSSMRGLRLSSRC